MKSVSDIAHYIYWVIFLSFLVVPVAMTRTERNAKSDLDNRMLVEFPEIGDTGFEECVEGYLKDRIGLRDQMVTAYQILNDKVAGELEHPSYTYGREGYVFFRMHNNICYGPYHQTFAEAVLKMQEYCESRGVKFYFLFDPEKISVYRRYLPVGVNYSDEWVDEMLAYMKGMGVNCISNKELLIDVSYNEQVFNRKYDAGHWNDLGMLYGTNHLWDAVYKDFPEVTEYSMDEFDITAGIGQYLAASKFSVNEEVPAFALKTEWKDITKQYEGLKHHKSYRYFQYYVNQERGAEKYPKALIFHGSYYNRGPQFFVGRTSEYIGIHDYQNVLDLDYYFNIFQPELVVFEAAEYTLSDGYFDSSRMAELDYNPGLVGDGQDISDAIAKAKEQAEKFYAESDFSLNIISGDGFDNVYIERELPTARYVYLMTDDQVFDMQKDSYGIYSTGIPHDAIGDTVVLYYENYEGKKFYSEIATKTAQQYVQEITYTAGASYDAANNWYEFGTELKNNYFNNMYMQLLDSNTGEYLCTVMSTNKLGNHTDSYIHTEDTGWYKIRLKANSNLKDEEMDILAYLVNGNRYFYSFDLIAFDEKKAIVQNYEFYGPIQ